MLGIEFLATVGYSYGSRVSANGQTILVVDSDASNRSMVVSVLEENGFQVVEAAGVSEGLHFMHQFEPSMVISAAQVQEQSGVDFCARLREEKAWERLPFLLMSEGDVGGNTGKFTAEDFLVKPIRPKELLARVRLLVRGKSQRNILDGLEANGFAGTIEDVPVIDLVQAIEAAEKTGVVHFSSPEGKQATAFFRSGEWVDAECGLLQGEDAVFRLLTWAEGQYRVEFRSVRRRSTLSGTSNSLLLEGMRRLEEWKQVRVGLPDYSAVLDIDGEKLRAELATLDVSVHPLLRLIDGVKTFGALLDQTPLGDLETAKILEGLIEKGVVTGKKTGGSKSGLNLGESIGRNGTENAKKPGTKPMGIGRKRAAAATSPGLGVSVSAKMSRKPPGFDEPTVKGETPPKPKLEAWFETQTEVEPVSERFPPPSGAVVGGDIEVADDSANELEPWFNTNSDARGPAIRNLASWFETQTNIGVSREHFLSVVGEVAESKTRSRKRSTYDAKDVAKGLLTPDKEVPSAQGKFDRARVGRWFETLTDLGITPHDIAAEVERMRVSEVDDQPTQIDPPRRRAAAETLQIRKSSNGTLWWTTILLGFVAIALFLIWALRSS